MQESVWFKQTVEVKGSSPLLPEISNEHISARLSDTLRLVSTPGHISSFSGEMGEKRHVSNAVVNIQNIKCEEVPSPVPEDTTLPIPTLVTRSLPPASLCQLADEYKPPIEVVSQRYSLNVVSKISRASNVHSPYPRTARKQSKLSTASSEVSVGKPLAKAMVYAQERTTQCSSVLNDSVHQILNLKVPPSRITTSESNFRIGKIVNTRKPANSLKHTPSSVKETISWPNLHPSLLYQPHHLRSSVLS